MHRSLALLAAAAALVGGARAASAMPDGITGYSGLTPDKGCATCHPGGNPPVATIDGPTTLAPGASAEYTFTLTTNKLFGGLDVAVDDAGARLTPVSPMTQLLGGEITHTQPLAVQNGAIVVKLSVTAPPTDATITLHADGQADNKPQIADSSATPIDFKITVGNGGAAATGNTGGNGATGGTTTGGGGAAGAGTTPAMPVHGCAFAPGALDASLVPAWLALVFGIALVLRWRRD